MTAFQRLSTGPTLPDLIRRDADRRAQRSLHMLPADVWLRPATAAVFWQHRNNGLVRVSGCHSEKAGRGRLDRELGHVRPQVMYPAPRTYPARIREQAFAASSRATRPDVPAQMLRSWPRQAGMAACFAAAYGVVAAARLLNCCGLLSPDGIGVAITGADRLTRTGMHLWRSSQTFPRA